VTTSASGPATQPQRSFPAVASGRVALGAALWTVSILFFIDQAIAMAASSRPYSLATNLISDLGSTACGPSI
jgi:hypothetical protein